MKTILWIIILFSSGVLGQTISGRTNAVTVDYRSDGLSGLQLPAKRTYRALIIGISNYSNTGPDLQSLENPTIDAQTLYDTLTLRYTFDKENSVLLKNATRQQIIDGLDRLSDQSDDSDNVLIFYAGHGFWDKKTDLGYWLPSDARIESKSEWIANSTIRDYLSDKVIRAKHTLLISDACFAGSILKHRTVNAQTIVRISELYSEPSRTAMTSGNLRTVPDQSIFIQQLVKKLSDNEEQLLPARQLYTRIYEPIINNTSTNPVYGVIQDTGDGGGDFIFIRRTK